MSAITVFLLSLVAILAVVKSIKWFKNWRALPPGPYGYPVMGILNFIKEEFHVYLNKMGAKYGPVASFKMGLSNMVVLNNLATIKKALASKNFVSRPPSEATSLLEGLGIINSEGKLWKNQRRYLLHQKLGMRHWGQGMDGLETRIHSEVLNLLNFIKAKSSVSAAIDPEAVLNSTASNVVCSAVMSVRFNHEDADFKRFMQLFDEGFKLFSDTGAMNFLPFLKYLPGIKSTCKKLRANREEMLVFVKQVVEKHEAALDEDNPRDLMDSMLLKIREEAAKGGDSDFFQGVDPKRHLYQIVLDLFSAGVETIKTSVLWSLVHLIREPEVMRKCQAEIASVIGEHQSVPKISDMDRLPYTRAVIYEVLRRSTVVPLATTHSNDEATVFEGYHIPQHSHIIPNIYSVHMDPANFESPETFRPERFLSEDGTEVIKPEAFIPFSVGQRACMGDQLAEKELFLIVSSLIHNFDIGYSSKSEASPPTLRGVAGITVHPESFEIVAKVRPAAASIEAELRRCENGDRRSIACLTARTMG